MIDSFSVVTHAVIMESISLWMRSSRQEPFCTFFYSLRLSFYFLQKLTSTPFAHEISFKEISLEFWSNVSKAALKKCYIYVSYLQVLSGRSFEDGRKYSNLLACSWLSVSWENIFKRMPKWDHFQAGGFK